MYNWKKTRKRCSEESDEPQEAPQIQPLLINMGGDNQPASADIRVVENKIFFYGDVDTGSMLELNRLLVKVDIKLQNTRNILGDDYDPTIHLHVSTYGGLIYEALACVDTIRNLKTKVYTYADGNVASAGTLITAVGKKRFVGYHAHMLIHQLSSFMGGKFVEIEDDYQNLDRLMKTLKEFYKKYTKIPMKKLDEILKHDLWLNADECVQYGLVDEIR